jgi:Flp pilus assembly protein TadG
MVEEMLTALIVKAKNERGVTAVVVALVLFPLVALTALAIDIGHLYVVDNELQNAADAGALAGARYLYNDDGTLVNTGANLIARDAAIANRSENSPVEVNWSGGNSGDVQRGHWRFADSTFTPNASTDPVDLWDVTEVELDDNLDFINAVRVTTRREATPAASFFARIFGYEGFGLNSEAVAYLGFAGSLTPFDVDQPIAICRESILQGNEYSCNVGRMINSGGDITTHQTGGWTNLSQDSACTGGTNAQEVRSLVCGDGNPDVLRLGDDMATSGGDIQSAFNQLIACWKSETGQAQPWNMTLPVVTCPSNNVGTCEELRGAVNVNVVWITEAGEDPAYDNAPTQMAGLEDVVAPWASADPSGENRWNSFVQHFNLLNVDGTPVPYAKKSIYFLPDCTPHEPGGVSGGENFGIQAEIPVLVQ